MNRLTPESQDLRDRERPKWAFVASAALIGALLGYLVGSTGATSRSAGEDQGVSLTTTATTVADLTTTPPASTATTAGPRPLNTAGLMLGELVPSFGGALMIEFGAEHEGHLLAVWPSHMAEPALYERRGIHPFSLTVNASGTVVAARGHAATGSLPGILFVGRPASLRPTTFEAVSVVWHETDPSLLAWLTPSQPGGPTLWLGQVDDSGLLTSAEAVMASAGSEVLCYGRDGFVLSSVDPDTKDHVLVAFGTGGAEAWRAAIPAVRRVFATGCVLLIEAGESDIDYWLTTDLHRVPQRLDWLPQAPRQHGTPSPDGTRLAFYTRERFELWSVDGDLIYEAPFEGRMWHSTWSSDSRLVVAAGELNSPDGVSAPGPTIVIFDTLARTEHYIDFIQDPFLVFVVPVHD